ncbi:MAG: PhoU domain-containing protein [Candidatus Bathyarchaeia archaeon]
MVYQLSEEIRKVQFTGKSTYIISLPKRWVINLGLKAGSQLIASQQNNSLILTPKEFAKPSTASTEATIRISNRDHPDTITREIISLYLSGYNNIKIQTTSERINPFQGNAVKELTRRKLVGTEIISESPNEIMLQVLLSYPELSVENALRRICLIAKSMHEDAMQALKDLNKELTRDIIQLDDEVDRFSLYIIRQLKAAVQNERILKDIGLSNPKDCLGYRIIVKSVERIADHAVRIAENISLLEGKPSDTVFQRLSEMSRFSRSVFEDAIKSLFRKDYLLADQVVSKAKTITMLENQAIKEILSKTEQANVSNMRMIMESIRRTAEYTSDIAEIVLNLNVNQVITA